MSYVNIPKIIVLAKTHVEGWDFVEPTEIIWTKKMNRGAFWHPLEGNKTCKIEVGWEEGDHILWHEIFHSVFHYCPLRKTDGWWGESFCNVFHEVNEQKFQCGSDFPTEKDFERAIKEPMDINLTRYLIPCSLILKHVHNNPVEFREFFLQLNRQALNSESMFLSKMLKYDPGTGKQI